MAKKENNSFANRAIVHFADVAPFKSLNITPWWHVDGKGLHYSLESYNLDAFAHVCVVNMRGWLGFWKAASVVCVPYAKDMPLLYINYEKKFATETLNVDYLDTQLAPCDLTPLEAVKQHYADLPLYPQQAHWFDGLRLAPSDAKMGKNVTGQFTAYADAVVKAYSRIMPKFDFCDEKAKCAKIDALVADLLSSGSPTIDHVNSLIGGKDLKSLLTTAVFGTALTGNKKQ